MAEINVENCEQDLNVSLPLMSQLEGNLKSTFNFRFCLFHVINTDKINSEVSPYLPSVVHMRVEVLENLRVSLLFFRRHAVFQLFVDVRHGKLLSPDFNHGDVSIVVIVVGR